MATLPTPETLIEAENIAEAAATDQTTDDAVSYLPMLTLTEGATEIAKEFAQKRKIDLNDLWAQLVELNRIVSADRMNDLLLEFDMRSLLCPEDPATEAIGLQADGSEEIDDEFTIHWHGLTEADRPFWNWLRLRLHSWYLQNKNDGTCSNIADDYDWPRVSAEVKVFPDITVFEKGRNYLDIALRAAPTHELAMIRVVQNYRFDPDFLGWRAACLAIMDRLQEITDCKLPDLHSEEMRSLLCPEDPEPATEAIGLQADGSEEIDDEFTIHWHGLTEADRPFWNWLRLKLHSWYLQNKNDGTCSNVTAVE